MKYLDQLDVISVQEMHAQLAHERRQLVATLA